MQVTVARQLYVAKDEADKQAALVRQAAYTKRTVDVSRAPDAQGGSHVLAYADKAGATEENALFGTPDEIAAMLEALQKADVGYILLTIAGGMDAVAPFRARDHAGFLARAARAPRNINAMADTLKPRDAKEVEDAVRWALGERQGAGSGGAGHQARHRPPQPDRYHARSFRPHRRHALRAGRAGALGQRRHAARRDRRRCSTRTTSNSPSSRWITARCSAAPAGQGTLGGAIAANLSGPRRIKAGAARDHFLGVTAVTGRAETIKSGGRVVKNVTGYDLCKLFAGSWGTLAAMTDVTLKVLPKAETEATVLVEGLDDARACAAMAAAMGSSCDVSGAAHLPDHVASYFDGLPKPEAATALRLEGFAPSVKHRKEAARRADEAVRPGRRCSTKKICARSGAACGRSSPSPPKRRASARSGAFRPRPARGHEIAAAITPAAQMFYDWAGGLLWVAMPSRRRAGCRLDPRRRQRVGGHATLVRAPASVRASVDVFEPQDAALRP